jgi:hypothetical protein
VELKAAAFDAMRQVEMWTGRARALAQEVEKREAAQPPNNGVPIREAVDTDGPLVESTA